MKSFVMFRRFFTIWIAHFVILLVCGYLGRERMYYTNKSEQTRDILRAWEPSVFKICGTPALPRKRCLETDGRREREQESEEDM